MNNCFLMLSHLKIHVTLFMHIVVEMLSLLLQETYANEYSHICPFLAARTQIDSDHNQNRRLSSHSFSHESLIFFWIF